MKSVFTLFLLAPFFAIGQSWEEVSKKTAQTYHAGQYEQAVPLARQALKLAAAEFGATHLNYFNSVNDLASALKKVGAFTEAQLLEQQNLQTIGNTLGTENLTFINTLKNLGNTCLALENYQLAESTETVFPGLSFAVRYTDQANQKGFSAYLSATEPDYPTIQHL